MLTASERLARFTVGLQLEQIPEAVRRAASLHALDTLGCGLAAHALGEASYALAAARESSTAGPASVIGAPEGMVAASAALVNGTLCHALDFDDTHPSAVVHVSAGVVPAALAAAQAFGRSGAELVVALVAGNEVSIRLGNAGGGRFHARGFHPTGLCGVFGATAAVARLRALDERQTANAFGIAGSMASGLLEFLSDGAETKRLHPGWAGNAATNAVALAAHGATGPGSVLEGARGFFATYLHGEKASLEEEIGSAGERWLTPEIAYKCYPACHYTHAPVDALAELMREHELRAGAVASIEGFSDRTGLDLVCLPAEDKVRPRSAYDAKFSLPYCLAAQLVHGRLDVTSFLPDAIADDRVLSLATRVGHGLRHYKTGTGAFAGGVRVTLTDGRVLEREVLHQRGSAANPLSERDVLEKFHHNAALALTDDVVGELERSLLSLEGQPDAAFAALLGRAAPAAAG